MADFDDIYREYVGDINTWVGYKENKELADPENIPEGSADKGFFLKCIGGETQTPMTGDTEIHILNFSLFILFKYAGKDHSSSEEKAMSSVDAAIKRIKDFKPTGFISVNTPEWSLERIESTDYELFTLSFQVTIQWRTKP